MPWSMKLASDNPKARLAKSKFLPLTTTNFFALKGELETSLLSSFNVLRCRLYDSPTDVSVI